MRECNKERKAQRIIFHSCVGFISFQKQLNNMKSNKGAIELSLGMIVAVVFAIVLLSLALGWLTGLIGGITDMTETMKQEAQAKLKQTFRETNENFDIWPPNSEVGPKTRIAVVAGVKNNAEDGKNHNYVFNIKVSKVPDDANKARVNSWLTWSGEEVMSIRSEGDTEVPITIEIPSTAVKGTYIFTIIACTDFESDSEQKITLTKDSYKECLPDSLNIWGSSAKQFTLSVI